MSKINLIKVKKVEKMKARTISGLITIFCLLPIWFYLVYIMLSAANPDRLVWFLYYVYVPLGFINAAISSFSEKD